MSRKANKKLQSSFVKSGVSPYGEMAVEKIPYMFDAAERVASTYEKFNASGTSAKPYRSEIVLAVGEDPVNTILHLGKVITAEYARDFVYVDTPVSTASNRSADLAIHRLQKLDEVGELGFVFIGQKLAMPESQQQRTSRLNNEIGRLSVPAMHIMIPLTAQEIFDFIEFEPVLAEITSQV